MKLFSSLTNRIFIASTALAVLSIGVAIAIVNVRVTREAEGELQRGLEEAGRLVEQHHETQVESSLRMASSDFSIFSATSLCRLCSILDS